MNNCIKCDVQMVHKATCDICPNCGHTVDTFQLIGDMANQFNDSQSHDNALDYDALEFMDYPQ